MRQAHTWEPNSNPRKPLFALNERGIPFEYHYVERLKFEQHSREHRGWDAAHQGA
jgi:hypothetical protein